MKKLIPLALILLNGCNQKPPKDAKEIEVKAEKIIKDNFDKHRKTWQLASGNWVYQNNTLTQTETTNSYNAIINKQYKFTNFQAKVDFMPISGKWDASGGIIFRVKDKDNYYIIRANALEDNFSLYTYKNGSRSNLIEVSTKAPALKKWHTIKVVAKANHIQGYLDGKLLIDYKDNTFKSGYTGLWTKADSVTKFDNFEVKGE